MSRRSPRYESRSQPPLTHAGFVRRVVAHAFVAFLLVLGSIAIGMAGYMGYEDLAWRDAFLNVAMLLGGMGPVDPPHSDAGKVFAGLFALYAGLVFIVTAALLSAPLLHRVLHRFHWDDKE